MTVDEALDHPFMQRFENHKPDTAATDSIIGQFDFENWTE